MYIMSNAVVMLVKSFRNMWLKAAVVKSCRNMQSTQNKHCEPSKDIFLRKPVQLKGIPLHLKPLMTDF